MQQPVVTQSMTKKTAVILSNVGTPDEPKAGAVRRFLFQFLNDKYVIDLPWLLRIFLVNCIIIPFRVKKSTALYKRLWTENGSPIIYYSEELKTKLQKKLGNKFEVFIGMRYGNPGYKAALKEIKKAGFSRVVIFPLFPQYAQSITETAIVSAEKEIKKLNIQAEVISINQFYNHPKYIEAVAAQAKKYDLSKYDHIVFSYHGLPNRQIEKCHPGIKVESCNCSLSIPDHGQFCYRATCYATSRLIAKELGLKKSDYTNAFQSRLSKNWLSPFTDDILLEKLKEGKKNILVLAPSFVTDCLETVIEIGADYQKLFKNNGGQTLQLVEGLNAEDIWVDSLTEIINTSLK